MGKAWILILFYFMSASYLAAQANVEIEGFGFLKDRDLRQKLAFLQDVQADEKVVLDTAFIEDSVFILMEQIKQYGYLKPTIVGHFQTEKGMKTVRWEEDYNIKLDIGFEAKHARFEIRTGLLYYYDSIKIKGIKSIPSDRLRSYFIPDRVLIDSRGVRFFTNENCRRRTNRILLSLQEKGYRSAQVSNTSIFGSDFFEESTYH